MFFVDGAATLNSRRLPQVLVRHRRLVHRFRKIRLGRCGHPQRAACRMPDRWHHQCAYIVFSTEFWRRLRCARNSFSSRSRFPDCLLHWSSGYWAAGVRWPVDQSLPSAFYYIPFSTKADLNAMPSGHATAAFSALIVVGSLWPKTRPYLWVYAIAVALSRVILMSHFVSDVIVGALVGSFGAIMIRNAFAARGLVFYRNELGQVAPKPGPSWRRIKALARAIRGQ